MRKPVRPDQKYCLACGAALEEEPSAQRATPSPSEPPAPSVEVTATPREPPYSQLTLSSRRSAAFWLGLVGAIFGLLPGAIFVAVSAGYSYALGELSLGIAMIVFSILGNRQGHDISLFWSFGAQCYGFGLL